ncbi:hypothetical protein CTA2_4870 [Colletotrichum tanaceti]|uniref:DUF7514 domain-containing protein n=1 Tax=Colletotrichum tanaceti TaxID=1306861 RepID=A0A4U6XTV1_9PEZI|nr:hypothetical protein CTA2_4870 [Colletotrichum tanaceti]TKW59374.1 hypothetical protein CTA1_10244 [Colletotrichum tanaceti]
MAASPAKKAAGPSLNTTEWILPRYTMGRPSESDEELSLPAYERDIGQHRWKDQKGSHGDGSPSDRHQEQKRQGSDTTPAMDPFTSRSRDRFGNLPSNVVEELKKMIKEEVAQAAQAAQPKSHETETSIEATRLSSFSSQNSAFTPPYPGPTPSVIEPPGTSKVSYPKDRIPGDATHAKTAPAPQYQTPSLNTLPASQSISSIIPEQKAVHFRSRVPPVIHCQPRVDSESESVSPTNPVAAPRIELSSVDKAWGMLFDSEGYPTQRLNAVLRGLAIFMITEFGPPETLVVTPDKMLSLYSKYRVEPEKFEYEEIFKSRSDDALKRVEFLYQDLDCQYHLVQAAPRSHPNVPGLTPIGFAKWMISNILAYPDPEARRLHAVMSALPVNADGPLLDGKPERLPRQLSRHLFPESHDRKLRRILDEAVWDCLEDIAPPLPSIPRARPSEANTHTRRSGGASWRPVPVSHRKTYDRGSSRFEPHSARLLRTNSDAGGSLPRHRDLPPPPMGRHSDPPRQRSPAPSNRYSASLPTISQHQHHAGSLSSPSPSPSPSSSSQLNHAYDIRGSEANYGVYPGRDGRGQGSRDESPRSPGLGRRGGARPGPDRGPTWEDVYSRKESSSGGRVSSTGAASHRSSR